jgi:hypothetical protein
MWANYRRHTARTIVLVVALYLMFVMDLGTATCAQHLYRIGTTPEARQMTDEMVDTTVAIAEALVEGARRQLPR